MQIFNDLLDDVLEETGRTLDVDIAQVRQYAAEQMAKLALAVGEPGYMRAAKAARNNVTAFAALEAVDTADAIDARIIGTIGGGMALGAQIIAGAGSVGGPPA